MKKGSIFFALTFISVMSIAQVQRAVTPPKATSPVSNINIQNTPGADAVDNMNKKRMMRELNLTREQKIKFKEFRQSNKAKREAISNDEKMTADQKEASLKALKREQTQNIQTILTAEQKAKMQAMRQERKKKATGPGAAE